MHAKRKQRWKILGVCVASFLFLEILLRLFLPDGVPYAPNRVYDPLLGHRGPKNKTVRVELWDMHYNEIGFRESMYLERSGIAKKGVQQQMLFLGDSITEGISVHERYRFPNVLARMRMMEEKRPFLSTVIAASDYGTAQEHLAYLRYGNRQDYDYVLLQFLGLNDFLNNGILFSGTYGSQLDSMRPYAFTPDVADQAYRLDVKEVEGLKVAYQSPWWHWLRRGSLVFRSFEALSQRLVNTFSRPAPLSACPVFLQMFLTERDARWQQAMGATRLLARMLKSKTEKEERRFIAFYVPSPLELMDDLWAETEKGIKACFPGKFVDRHAGEAAFQKIFLEEGAEIVTLWPALEKTVKSNVPVFLNDGHFDYQGHRVAAEALQSYFRRNPEAPKKKGKGK